MFGLLLKCSGLSTTDEILHNWVKNRRAHGLQKLEASKELKNPCARARG